MKDLPFLLMSSLLMATRRCSSNKANLTRSLLLRLTSCRGIISYAYRNIERRQTHIFAQCLCCCNGRLGLCQLDPLWYRIVSTRFFLFSILCAFFILPRSLFIVFNIFCL